MSKDYWKGYVPEPAAVRDAIVSNLVREGINKHRARELADHFIGLDTPQPAQQQEPVKLPCCGYTDASAIKWNPHNQVVQCHNCGQVYAATKPEQPQRRPLTDEQLERFMNDYEDFWIVMAVIALILILLTIRSCT